MEDGDPGRRKTALGNYLVMPRDSVGTDDLEQASEAVLVSVSSHEQCDSG